MKYFYSAEGKPITVHNGKTWLTVTEEDLHKCFSTNPTTKDTYSLIFYPSYEEALEAAKDGVTIAPKGTAPRKKVELTSSQQYAIVKWQFNGAEKDIKEDKDFPGAKRIYNTHLTPVSISIKHVNPSRFYEIPFDMSLVSNDEANEVEDENEVELNTDMPVTPKQAQANTLVSEKPLEKTPTNVVEAHKEEPATAITPLTTTKPVEARKEKPATVVPSARPTVNARTKPSVLGKIGSGLWSVTKGLVTRPSVWFAGAAAAVTEYGPEIIKNTIPDVPYVGDAVTIALTTAAVVETGVGIYQGVQYCKKPASELDKLKSELKAAKSQAEIEEIFAKRAKPLTTAHTLATSTPSATTPVVKPVDDKKKSTATKRV